ncbi:MAG: hypothetical protein WC091_08535 [Sulfuricellaceae bacterium]
MEILGNIWETLKHIVENYHVVIFIIAIAGVIWGCVLWARGILPVIIRLGKGLANRKIALFAKGDNLSSLKKLLTDSGLFDEKNICEIANEGDIGRAEQASVYLVHWPDWANAHQKILDKKPDGCALIVYAPGSGGKIPPDVMNELDTHRNTAVTNFRGRLLNDIVTAMITTSYTRK